MSVKMFARNSGAGNGCANLWAPGKIAFFLQENPHAHKMPRFGGGIWGFWGGGSADLIFMGAGIFLRNAISRENKNTCNVIFGK